MLESLGNEFGAPEAVPLGECINFAQETALDAYENLGGSLTNLWPAASLDCPPPRLGVNRFTRKDVEGNTQALWGCASHSAQSGRGPAHVSASPTTGPADGPTTAKAPESHPTDEEKPREAERERRMKAVEAATQPAKLRDGYER